MYRLGYMLGVVMLIGGGLILAGRIGTFPGEPPGGGGSMLRTVFGIVLMLYGLYRLALTEMQRRARMRGDE